MLYQDRQECPSYYRTLKKVGVNHVQRQPVFKTGQVYITNDLVLPNFD